VVGVKEAVVGVGFKEVGSGGKGVADEEELFIIGFV
jgi:hypothetical protein